MADPVQAPLGSGLANDAKKRIRDRMAQIDDAVSSAQGDAKAAAALAAREAAAIIGRRSAQTTDKAN